jgi:hypothetical protein
VPVAVQMLLPCSLSSELTAASEKLSMGLFHSDKWTGESVEFKRNMKIFIENTKKPVKIVVLKIFAYNLESFVKIMNSAYSLFAVLREINFSSNEK